VGIHFKSDLKYFYSAISVFILEWFLIINMEFSISSIKEVFTSNFVKYLEYFFHMLKNPSFTNPFYIILTIYFLTFMLEVLLPKKENYPLLKRKGFKVDLMYLVFIDFVFSAVGFYAITSVIEFLFVSGMGKAGIAFPLIDVNALPFIGQILIFLILVDFVQFLGHYLLHRIDFLWEFHKMHHAQEQLGFASTRHFHWFEYIVFKPLLYIPFGFLGFGAQQYVIYYLWFGYFFTFFSHCNVKLNWGFLSYIFINPDTHYWHHSKNSPGRFGVNFASVLPVWDVIFGTFYLPKNNNLKPELGVHDQKEMPRTFFGQMLHPFKTILRQNKISAKMNHQGIDAEKLTLNMAAEGENTSAKKLKQWKKKK
jgi:sterol desaturase/sphingolipid hydroxylase (fatty acid hydroxylase superfamily)